MSVLNEHYTLYNGVQIPKIGFGTWQIPNEVAVEAVSDALKVGYRHIDTALAYINEEGVGQAIRESGLKREEIFITSKLPAQIKGYDNAMESFNQTMKNLGIDVLDLYLIHAPWPWTDKGGDYTAQNIQSWKAFEKLYKEGRVRAIGVSNFSPKDIQAILDNCEIVPMANQIAFHVGRTQKEYVDFCNKHNILVEGYSPLATGRALSDKFLNKMAVSYGVSVAQLLIRFALQRGILPLPKSTTYLRMLENTQVDHFSISQTDMEKLDSIKSEYR
jgi:diketogulonate reductase-like aldo/keto reductase